MRTLAAYRRSESFFKGAQDVKLYMQKWECKSPKGFLLLTHGHGEHSGSYERLIRAIEPLQLTVIAWDLRGHGKSEGQRGYAESFAQYVFDFESFFRRVLLQDIQNRDLPVFLFAHSMGGLIQAKALCEAPNLQVRAQVLSSPYFGLSLSVPKWKTQGAEWLHLVLPKLTLGNEIKDELLTRDPLVVVEYERDNLRHNSISSGVFLGIQQAQRYVLDRIDKVKIPTFLQISDNDPVVSTSQAQLIFEKLGAEDKTWKTYEDFRHEIYNDLGRESPQADLLDFLQKRL